MKLTEQEFWEKCGFRLEDKASCYTPSNPYLVKGWVYLADTLALSLPSIHSLDALFKWAVPKIDVQRIEFSPVGNCTLIMWNGRNYSNTVKSSINPALALAEAIEKVIGGNND